ncbi:MAG: hypothetical protein ACT6RD_13700 [Brevundimonas sp.]|uniref:hypothetical protein n=1 Tax=Brevundimonas sp. TaxID=1871086 RepID=UPI0040349A13
MAEMAAAAWAVVKAASAYIIKAGAAVAAGNATLAQTAAVIAVNVAGSVAMSAIAGVLAKPGVGSTAPGEWVADPNAGIPFAIGERIGAGGNLVYKNTYGKDTEYKGIVTILSGAGPIGGFLDFTADKEAVTWAGDTWPADPTQTATSAPYKGEKMWMRRQLGQQPEVFALSSPSSLGGWSLPEWTWQHKLSGKAAFHWTLRRDSKFSAFEQGEPDPLTVMEGIAGYDPRFDSTYPGGDGPVRLNDRTTWPTIKNGAIADLNWCLGLRENGKVVGGLGVSSAGIDWAAYIEAANVADANDWKIAAYPRSDQNKSEVRAAMLQSAGAVISRRAGLVSCVTRGVAKVPVMTIRAGDTAGAIELDTAANVLNRLNTITPRYLSEAHGWQLVPAGPVSSSVYLDEDGREASDARDYPYVPSAKQAAELAALDLAHTREGIGGRWPLKPYCRDIEPGEAFDIDEPGLLLDGMTMLCLTRDYDPATDTVWLTFVSETEGKVDWALGRTASPPPTPSLSARPVLNPPTEEEVVIIPRLPGEDGVQIPIIDVEVTPDNPRAEVVVIEWAPAEGDPPLPIEDVEEPELLAWSPAYEGRAVTGSVAINGIQPGAKVYLSIQYRTANEGLSERLLSGPVTTPGMSFPVEIDPAVVEGIVTDKVTEATAALNAAIQAAQDALAQAQIDFTAAIDAANQNIADAQSTLQAAIEQAEADFNSAQGSLQNAIDAVDDKADGIQSGLNALITVVDGKASTAQLNFQINRIDNVSTRVGLLETTVVDFPNQYASAATVNSLQSEINAARNGSANLNAQLQVMRTATTDGLAGKVSTSALATQVSRIDSLDLNYGSLSSTVANHTTTLANLPSQYTAASAFTALQSEVVAARNGSANLNAQLQTMRTTTADGLAGKVSTSDFNFQVSRIDSLNGTVGALSSTVANHTTTLADLPNQYGSASAVSNIQSELTAARNGSANLNAQLQTMRTATTDGLALKASATDFNALQAEVVAGRGGTGSLNGRFNQLYQILVDGDALKVDLWEYNTLKAEVQAARNGSANLNAQLSAMRTATTDGLALKASTSALATQVSRIDSLDMNYGSLASTVSNHTTTLADLPNQYASASAMSSVQSEIANARGGQASLSARFTQIINAYTDGLNLKAGASVVAALQVQVDGFDTRITTAQSIASEANNRSKAIFGIQSDVNGYITGYTSTNNGATTTFDIRTDKFRLMPSSSSGARTEFSSGTWKVYHANGQKAVEFGVIA